MTAPIDYQAVLADLEAKREQLDAAIAGIRVMLGVSESDAAGAGEPAKTSGGTKASGVVAANGTVVATDTFFGLSTSQAVRKFLSMTKRPQAPRAIADALHHGGQVHAVDQKTAYTNVYTALKRGKDSDFSQTRNGEWGLAEWYTNKPKAEGE